MNVSLDAKILSSFKEHITYRLIEDCGAHSTKTVNLYQYTPNISGKIAYGSAFHNWIYDSSTVTPPTTVGGMVRGGAEGLKFDFRNGRILVNSVNTGLSLSLSVPIAEFGVHVTSSPDSQLINEVNFLQNPDQIAINTYVKPDTIITPAIFVKIAQTKNRPFALSGLDWTTWRIRTIVFAQTHKQLVGVGGMIRDLRERMIPILTPAQTPLNEYNDIKSPPYTYETHMQNVVDKAIVMESVFDPVEVDTFAKFSPTILVGIGETDVYFARTSRS